jgi:uncharacterized protein YndB with AHSA1/START domain
MRSKPDPSADPTAREITITRVFDAPRSLVFKAWTRPEQAAQWWGPQGFTVVSLEMDVRPGGAWRKCMRSPEGREYWRHGVYRVIVEPERLVFTYFSDDAHTNPGHETLVTVTFSELGAKTKMIFHHALFESVEARDAHQGGWSSTLERFGEYVAAIRE